MKKKIVITIIVAVLVFAMAACGGSKDGKDGDKGATGAGSGTADSGGSGSGDGSGGGSGGSAAAGKAFSFSPKGVKIAPGEDAAPVIEKLGDPLDIFEADSCAFVGKDRIFYYQGFNVTTYPAGEGVDRILSVTLTDDSVETDQGVCLGMAKADVLAAYGEGEQSNGSVSYYSGGTELRIFFENDKAADIALYNTEVIKIYEEAQ